MTTDRRYTLTVLFDGYSQFTNEGLVTNCTCTLLRGPLNIIIDTMTPWDGDKITLALKEHNVECDNIDYVICTHGHSDHIGCNYLFKKAVHIVGFCISRKDLYYNHDFTIKPEYIIDSNLKVVATPGHTLQDVTVVVNTVDKGIVAITGDLFEKEEDLKDDSIWTSVGSDSKELQVENRNKMLAISNWIVPGHGPIFRVK